MELCEPSQGTWSTGYLLLPERAVTGEWTLKREWGPAKHRSKGKKGSSLGKTGVLRACPGTDVRPGGARKAVSACR